MAKKKSMTMEEALQVILASEGDSPFRAMLEFRAGRGKPDSPLSGKLLPRDERSSKDGEKTEKEPGGGF